MARVRSELQIVLVDGVSLPAGKVRKALRELDASNRAVARSAGGAAGAAGGSGVLAAGGRMLLGGAAIYGGARLAADSYKDAAALSRRMQLILNTAGQGKEAMSRLRSTIYSTADDAAAPVEKVVGGIESLVAAGRSLPDAMVFLPSVTRTAQAAGAEVLDLALTADAFGTSFKIAGKDMQSAFDMALKLGKEGKFELKDQARYMPSILPLAGTRGLKGLDGLAKVGAALQVIRRNSGSAEEAAASMTDVLGKLDSDETIKRMKKTFGVDLPKELNKARKAGVNTFDAFLDIVEVATKGDMEKVGKIFNDKEARRGLIALMQYRQGYKDLQNTAKNSAGEVAKDIKTVTSDAEAGLQRLSDGWGRLKTSIGDNVALNGGTEAVSFFADALQRAADNMEKLNAQRQAEKAGSAPGGGREERIKQMMAANPKLTRDDADVLTYADENWFGGTFLNPAPSQMKGARNGKIAERETQRATLIEGLDQISERFMQIRGRLMKLADEPVLNAQQSREKEQLTAAIADLAKQRSDSLDEIERLSYANIEARRNEAMLGRPTPGALAYPPGEALGPVSGATRARPRENLTGAIAIDPAAYEAAAMAARDRAQEKLNANPLVIPVRAGDVSGAMGRAVSSGVSGSLSDPGAGQAPR